jgi:hypothetical protein
MSDKIKIGEKGELEPGYVLAPYIPMTSTSVILDILLRM